MLIQCPACSSVVRPQARFCDQCARPLEVDASRRTELRPELRRGTLLFCDLVASTELANTLDHEDLRLVFSSFHRVVREVSRRHSGYLIRFVGDGAFVAFGYPAAQEDSAESAVRAGLDLVLSIRDIRAVPAASLELRVGVASGTIAMGDVIDGAAIDEHSISGAVVHLAARLASSAAPGGVVICDETQQVAGRRFVMDRMEPLLLRGFRGPVPAWAVRAEREPMSRFDAHRASGGMGEMVGRDEVLAQLAEAWKRAAGGSGQVAWVTGDAGIGKSRLVHALDRSISNAGSQTLDLQCTPRTRNSPLFPVAVLLRRLADVELEDDERTTIEKANGLLRGLLPESDLGPAIRHLLPMLRSQTEVTFEDGSPEMFRQRTIGYLVQLVGAIARRRPILLIVEDLHWADATTKELLRTLFNAAAAWPILAAMTSRELEVPIGDPGAVLSIALAPLPPNDARRVVERSCADHPLAGSAIEWVIERAEGNPLFLEELTLGLRSGSPGPGSGDAAGPARGIPATLQNVIQARLDRLPGCKPLVQAASVLGREFSWRVLATLAADDHSDIAVPIGRLIEQEILVATGAASAGALRFKHALIHEAVYDTLLRGERRLLHSRAADLLAGRFAGSVYAAQDVVAHHLTQAGRIVEAVRCLTEASMETAQRAAYAESIGHGRGGLRLLPQVEDATLRRTLHLGLVVPLGLSLTATLGYADPQVERLYTEALDLCDESTDPAELYPSVRGLGSYYLVRGQIGRADALAIQCIELAERSGRSDLLIDARAFAAYPAAYLGRLTESQDLLVESLELYATKGGGGFKYTNAQDPATGAWALLTTIAWIRGDLHVADAAAESLLEHLNARKHPFDTTYGTVWLSGSCQLQRRFAKAIEYGSQGQALAQQHGYGTWIPAALMQICIATGALQPSPESVGTLQYVHGKFMEAGAEISATFYLWGIAQAMRSAGDEDGARRTVAAALRRADAGDETYMKGELLILAATLEADREESLARLWQALEHAERHHAWAVALRAASAMAIALESTPSHLEMARHALAVLDSQRAIPAETDWVARTLDLLKSGFAGRRVVVPRDEALASE